MSDISSSGSGGPSSTGSGTVPGRVSPAAPASDRTPSERRHAPDPARPPSPPSDEPNARESGREPAVRVDPSLARLVDGFRLDGRLDPPDDAGRQSVETRLGRFIVAGDGLPRQGAVTFEIHIAATRIEARLVATEGEVLTTPRPVALTPVAPIPPLAAPPGGAPSLAKLGSVLTSLADAAPQISAAASPLAASIPIPIEDGTGFPSLAGTVLTSGAGRDALEAGTLFSARLLAISSSEAISGVTAATKESGPEAPSADRTPRPAAAGTSHPLAAAATVATLLRTTPVIAGASQGGPAPSPGTIATGIAIARPQGPEPAGLPAADDATMPTTVHLRTRFGLVAAQMPEPVAAGTTVTFEITSVTPPGTADGGERPPAPAPGRAAEHFFSQLPIETATLALGPAAIASRFAAGWPELEEALAVVERQNASETAKRAEAILPAPGPRFAGSALFFLAALNGGNIARWLGEAALETLTRSGRRDLVQKLESGFRDIARTAFEAQPGDWRPVIIPFAEEGHVRPLIAYVRDEDQEHDETGDGGGTRFVIELTLSRFGAIQLDGRLGKGRFDLLIRTAGPLPAAIRNEVTRIFIGHLEASARQGSVTFRPDAPFANPLGELQSRTKPQPRSLVV